MAPSDILLRKLQYHSPIDGADVAAIRRLRCETRELVAGEEFIRQGDKPRAAAVVIEGIMARYHTLRSGTRQYLALHYPGDWPDAQGLFLQSMDHSVCAMARVLVCSISHEQLMKIFDERPTIGFAVWRETLIDAAIFRESITNNASRHGTARIAHFFCEQFSRAKFAGLAEANSCPLPLTQTQTRRDAGDVAGERQSSPSSAAANQIRRFQGRQAVRPLVAETRLARRIRSRISPSDRAAKPRAE